MSYVLLVELQMDYDNLIPLQTANSSLFFCTHEFQDRNQLMHLLINYETVEHAIENRVESKAKIFGQELNFGADNGAPPVYKIRPRLVAELYSYRIMLLSREVHLAYLLRRLD
jgi:chorismate mutase